jgi:Selenoprotein, putative
MWRPAGLKETDVKLPTPRSGNFVRFHLPAIARGAWAWLRQVTGDAAYENYLRSIRRAAAGRSAAPAHAGCAPLSRADFYLDALRRRYSTVSRCC